MTDDPVLDRLGRFGVIPVAVIDSRDQAVPLGRALAAGGLPLVEVTLRTGAALDAIRLLAGLPGLLVGAGTVTSAAQVRAVLDAGARFVVSPGLSRAVVETCQEAGLAVLPGVSTATEIQAAIDCGLDTVKFFPAAAAGGSRMVAALAAPFPQVRFVPTGGVGPEDLSDYLALTCVLAVGGSWLIPRDALAAGDLDRVTALTADAVRRVGRIREAGVPR